ncbi:MAG: Crp/Fnr family transcriptional regulator [Dehalococcoidia bacterium]
MPRDLISQLVRHVAPHAETETPGGAAWPGASKLGLLSMAEIFRDLTPPEMAEVDRMTAMTTCRRGRAFYTPGETGEVLFILKRGRVNVYRVSADGRKLVTATIGPGTIFGEMSLLGQGMNDNYAEAAQDCTLCVMSRDDVERLVASKPAVALRLIQVLAQRLHRGEEQLEEMAFKRIEGRLASTLLRLSQPSDHAVHGYTHQDLADMMGTYRETVSRCLSQFADRGLVELGRKKVVILERQKLETIAQQ